MKELTINIMLTKQNVNMGDHAETMWEAVAPVPGETVENLVERTLVQRGYIHDSRSVLPNASITLRIAEAPEPKEES